MVYSSSIISPLTFSNVAVLFKLFLNLWTSEQFLEYAKNTAMSGSLLLLCSLSEKFLP